MKLLLTICTSWLLCSITTAKSTNIDAMPFCANSAWLCDTFNGAFCIDRAKGQWCCDDGTGSCGKGFICGTGPAINRCCPLGITMQQCANAIVVNKATVEPSYSSPPPPPTRSSKRDTTAVSTQKSEPAKQTTTTPKTSTTPASSPWMGANNGQGLTTRK